MCSVRTDLLWSAVLAVAAELKSRVVTFTMQNSHSIQQTLVWYGMVW